MLGKLEGFGSVSFSCFWSALWFFHNNPWPHDAIKALCHPGLFTHEIADTQLLTGCSSTAACKSPSLTGVGRSLEASSFWKMDQVYNQKCHHRQLFIKAQFTACCKGHLLWCFLLLDILGEEKSLTKISFRNYFKGNSKAIQNTLFMGYYITVKTLVLHRSLFHY